MTALQGDLSLGNVVGVILHPDRGSVEGFMVRARGFPRHEALFLSVHDISHWGARVRVRSADCLAPLDDFIRLKSFLQEGRTILGQRIMTAEGQSLGVCRDVQFETKLFALEWLFPRKFFRRRPPIPVSAIIEVRSDAVIVRDPLLPAEAGKKLPVMQALQELAERLPEVS